MTQEIHYSQDTLRKNQYSPAQIADMYNGLLALGAKSGKRQQKVPTKWNDNEFNTASGYAIRVAQNHTLPEFTQFVHTGQPVHPVKMTPAEMEVLMGGSKATDWIIAVGGAVAVVVTAAGAAACA